MANLSNHIDQRIEQYGERFEQLQEVLRCEKKFPTLMKMLDLFVPVFGGEIVYTYHEVSKDKLRVVFGGPLDYLHRRSSKALEVSRNEGYIGKTLRLPGLFQIFETVNEDDGYLLANPSTKSEMVVKILGADPSEAIAILNIESSEESDFTMFDGIVFSLIASWQANFMTENNREKKKIAMIQKISEIFHKVREAPCSNNLTSTYAELLKIILPYDAFSIASIPHFPETIEERRNKINIDFCEGYVNPERYKQDCSSYVGSFPYNVLVSGGVHEEILEEQDNQKIKEYRGSTQYALGACFPKHEGGYPSAKGAVLVEFDKKPVGIEEPLDLLQEMSELYGQIRQSSDQFLDWSNLARVNASLPKFDLMHSYDIPAAEFLSKIAEELANNLNAERCIFFEIINEGGKSSLRTIASSPTIGNGSNIFWEQELNKLFVEEIQQNLHLRQKVNYEEVKLFDFSGAIGIVHYVVSATRLQARLNSREFLFVSLKCAKGFNLSKAQIPRVASNILAIQLQYISTILERKKHATCAKTLKNSMRISIRLLFDEVEQKKDSQKQYEEAIFERVHYLLEKWDGVIGTPYAAIYKYDESKDRLIMTQATYNFMKDRHRKDNARGHRRKFPERPLEFDVNPRSELADRGLTFSIWSGRNKSLVSVNVGEQGSSKCKLWWDDAVGASAKGRYFAGAKISDEQPSKRYGVLTINGNKPAGFIARDLEAEWEVLPLLEVLSEELGRYLGKLYNPEATR